MTVQPLLHSAILALTPSTHSSAGKTTTLYRLQLGEVVSTIPSESTPFAGLQLQLTIGHLPL